MTLNQRGQAFASYRLLIGAIMALLILAIIVGAITYLRTLESDISAQKLAQGVANAVKQPNGRILKLNDLALAQGGYSANVFSRAMNLDEECVYVDAVGSTFESTGDAVIVKHRTKASVYARCDIGSGACEIQCEVRFGAGFD